MAMESRTPLIGEQVAGNMDKFVHLQQGNHGPLHLQIDIITMPGRYFKNGVADLTLTTCDSTKPLIGYMSEMVDLDEEIKLAARELGGISISKWKLQNNEGREGLSKKITFYPFTIANKIG